MWRVKLVTHSQDTKNFFIVFHWKNLCNDGLESMTPGRLLKMEIWIGILFVSLKCPVIVCMHPKRCIRSKTWMARAHARISAACFMLMMKNLHARLYALKNCEMLHKKRCDLSIKQKKAIIAWKWCDILEFKAYDYWVLFLQQQACETM